MKDVLPPVCAPVRLSLLRQKELFNIRTCRTLGCASDLEIDPQNGCIVSLIVPGMGKLCWFLGREYEYIIPWRCIVRIGADIILVDVDEESVRRKCE